MLAVNMQTSFMHPPFGFSLFFLRSVAPTKAYKDRVTGRMTEPVTTGQIYWGSVPFVGIQIIMVALVIMFPWIVTHYQSAHPQVDPDTIEIAPPPTVDFGAPAGGAGGFDTGAPPSFDTGAPAAPPAFDAGAPPKP